MQSSGLRRGSPCPDRGMVLALVAIDHRLAAKHPIGLSLIGKHDWDDDDDADADEPQCLRIGRAGAITESW